MSVSDAEVVEVLTGDGATVADHFLIDETACLINTPGELMMMAIDDEELAHAVVAYLRRAGAPEYSSVRAYEEHRQRRTNP